MGMKGKYKLVFVKNGIKVRYGSYQELMQIVTSDNVKVLNLKRVG